MKQLLALALGLACLGASAQSQFTLTTGETYWVDILDVDDGEMSFRVFIKEEREMAQSLKTMESIFFESDSLYKALVAKEPRLRNYRTDNIDVEAKGSELYGDAAISAFIAGIEAARRAEEEAEPPEPQETLETLAIELIEKGKKDSIAMLYIYDGMTDASLYLTRYTRYRNTALLVAIGTATVTLVGATVGAANTEPGEIYEVPGWIGVVGIAGGATALTFSILANQQVGKAGWEFKQAGAGLKAIYKF